VPVDLAADPLASGRAFLGIIRHIKDSWSGTALSDVVSTAGPATREVFRHPIRGSHWYPYPAFVQFLIATDKAFGKGDLRLCTQLGAAAGKRDLGSIFRVYVALSSAEHLIRSCAKVWPTYYRNMGTMEAVSWTADRTILRISGFPGMHPAHCRLMEGWMITTMATIGCQVSADAGEKACTSRGDPYHEFRCSWTKR
jgi:hypothetical protein